MSIVAFTGAGISTESGIPDFRSPGGLWSRFKPIDYQDYLESREARAEYWSRSRELWPTLRDARPNAGHEALARAEADGKLSAVITQNIDGLHQMAGSRRVLEIHGTARRVGCLDCGRQWDREEIQARVDAGQEVPDCDRCGGVLKTATVSFGQPMPADTMREAVDLVTSCRVLVVVGSSLTVHPAAALPGLAVRSGARLIILNRDPTPYDELASSVIREPAGSALGPLLDSL